MAAEGVEIHAQVVEAHADVRRALCAVAHHQRAGAARDGGDLAHGIHRAERVGDVIEGYHLGARRDEEAQRLEIHMMVRCEGAHVEQRPHGPRELLPRDEVGVMLQRSHDDLVTRAHVRAAPRRRDEIERFGRAAREDEAIGVPDTEESRNRRARLVVPLRGASRQVVRAPMGIGVVVFVVGAHRIEHDARLLRRGGGVEVVQARRGGQQGEVVAPVHGGHGTTARWRSAACNVCHGMLAHLTRTGKRATPLNAAISPIARASPAAGLSFPVTSS